MPSLPSSSPEKCTAMATSEFSTGKTIFVLAIVVGCFAILWPKVFYPMVQTSFTMTKPHLETDRKEIPKSSSSVCCDVVVDYDINNKFFAKLCGLIVNPHELTTTRPLGEEKLPPGMAQVCREKVLELCSIDVIELLQKDPKDPAYQKVLQEIHFQNVTHCLQYHYAKHEKYLDLANKRKQQDAIRKPIRQDRPTHLHPALIHPAMRERGVPIASRAGEHFTQKPKPGPMTVARPSPGSHGKLPPPVPKGAGSIGFVMPMYTVGIVIFFIYTVMKVLFKRTEDKTPKVMDFHMDPEYRKYMLSEEYADSHLETYREFIHKEKPLLGKPLLDEEERKLEEVTEPGFQEMFTAIEGIIAEMDEYRERLKTGQQESENSGLPSEQIPSTIELPEVVHEREKDDVEKLSSIREEKLESSKTEISDLASNVPSQEVGTTNAISSEESPVVLNDGSKQSAQHEKSIRDSREEKSEETCLAVVGMETTATFDSADVTGKYKAHEASSDAGLIKSHGSVHSDGAATTTTSLAFEGKREAKPQEITIPDEYPSIVLDTSLPAESQLLVAESQFKALPAQVIEGEEYDGEQPVIISGKMTISLINSQTEAKKSEIIEDGGVLKLKDGQEAAEDTAMAVIGNFSKSSSPDIDTYEVIGGCKPDADPPSAEISLSSPTTQANEFVYINKEETQTIGLSPVESEGANGFEYIRPGECPVVNGEFSNFEGNTINKDSLITPVRDSSFENILLSESESDALKQFQTAAVLSSSDAQSKLDESVDYEQRFELPEEISLCPTTEPKLITPQDNSDIPKQTERTKDEYQEANLNSLMDKSQSGEQGLELSDDVGDHSTIETKLIISEANIDINKQIEKVMEEDIEAKFISLTDTLKAVETVDYGQTVEVDEELLDYSAIEPVIKSADSNNIQKEAERIDDEHLEANVISLTDTSSLVMTTPEDDSKLSSFVEVESYDGESSVDSDVIETLTVDAVRVSGAESQLIESSEKSELEKPEITTTKEDSKLNSFVEVELFQKESIGDATEMPETDRGFTTTITVLESSEPSFVVSDEKASSNESDIHQKESNTSSFVELEPCEESISEDAAKIHYTSMTTGSVLQGTQSEFLEDGEQKTIQEFTITEGDNLSLFEECELNKEKSNSSGNATEVLITDAGYALLASEEAQPIESIQTIALEEAKEMAEAAAKEETESQTGTISQETDFKKEASETISSAVSAIGESQELVSAEESKNITATDLREEIVTPPPQTIIIQNGNLNDNIEVDASSSSKTSIRSSASSTTQSEEEEEEDDDEEEEEEEESESEEEDRARVSLVHQMKEKPEENKPGSPVSPEHDRLSGCQIWSYWS